MDPSLSFPSLPLFLPAPPSPFPVFPSPVLPSLPLLSEVGPFKSS